MRHLETSTALTGISLVLLLLITEITAKRGCSAFGHSCFGGHGKRSNLNEEQMPIASHSNRQLNLPDDFLLLEPGQELREPARLMPSALAASQAQQQNPYPLAYYLNRWLSRRYNNIDSNNVNRE